LDYNSIFKSAIERLHDEGRYRVFIDILRSKGSFPNARCFGGNGPKPITVWCSNDYLCMGQHAAVVGAMEKALHEVGAGSGGTRNISGNTHYHTELETELASLHGKSGAAAAITWDKMNGPNNTLPDSDGNYREVWHYRREALPKGISYLNVDFDFITRKGYGKNVLQRDDRTLSTLETARKAMRTGVIPTRASK